MQARGGGRDGNLRCSVVALASLAESSARAAASGLASTGEERRDEGDEGAEDDDDDADPDPVDERIEEDLDDGACRCRGCGLRRRRRGRGRAWSGWRPWSRAVCAGDVEALLGGELRDLLVAVEDVEEGVVGVVVGVGVLGVALADDACRSRSGVVSPKPISCSWDWLNAAPARPMNMTTMPKWMRYPP